jgi:hypothetical protein
MKHVTNLSAEPIDPELRACIEAELANLPGARVIKRKGRLFLKGRGGLEILCECLFEMKAQWCALVEHADLAHEDKWAIFNLMIHDDGRLEQVPGGLKVTLPPRPRH